MKYIVRDICKRNIVDFYQHVSRKYRHTYSELMMLKNVDDAIEPMFRIEQSLLRRKPILSRWQNDWHMANAGKWYYAYTITDDTIIIEDACHEQNMHEENPLNS